MRFKFELRGESELLMHADDVLKADELSAFRKDPANKSTSVAGDDRSPAWSWITYLYLTANKGGEPIIGFPSTNLSAMLREAGAEVRMKGQKTFKSMTQSGIILTDQYVPFLVNGKEVKIDDISRHMDEPFDTQKVAFEKLADNAATIDVRRAAVGASKHVRCRPFFKTWSIVGYGEAIDPSLTLDMLQMIFELGGRLKGLGDWRPSARKPGPFGRFNAEVTAA